jgi:hypothetical protein
MATFQQSLSDVKVPAVGAATGATTRAGTASTAAMAINAITGAINTALPLIDKEMGRNAYQTTQKAAFKLIQEHDQGLINDVTFRTAKKQLAIEHFSTFDRKPEEVQKALVSAFGANPVERQEKVTATFADNMLLQGSVVNPGGTDEEKIDAGIQLNQDKIKAEASALAIKAATAARTATDNEQMTLAGRYVSTVAEPLGAVMQGAIDLAGNVTTPEQEKEFFGRITNDANQIIADFERVALQGLQGLGSKGFKEGIDRIKTAKDSFKAIFDPKTGVRGVTSKLEFLKKIKADTELDLIDAAPLVNRLHTLIGSQALSVIVANMVKGKIEFGAAIRTQLEGLLDVQGVTGEKKTKALSIIDIMRIHRDPDKTSEFLTDKNKRSAALAVSTDMINSIPLTKESSQADKDTFTRQSAAAMHLAIRYVRTPGNRKTFLDTVGSESYAKKLSELAKTDSKSAGILGRSAMRFGIGAVREALNESSRIRYNLQSGQLEFQESKIKTTPSQVGTLGAEVDEGPIKEEEAQIIENGNRALDLLDKYALYDERFSNVEFTKMGGKDRRDIVIHTIGNVTGKGDKILLEEQKFETAFTKSQTTGARNIVKPSISELENDRVTSVFAQKSTKLAEVTKKARATINRLVRDKKGKWTVVKTPSEGI